jgi:hypothetical protein
MSASRQTRPGRERSRFGNARTNTGARAAKALESARDIASLARRLATGALWHCASQDPQDRPPDTPASDGALNTSMHHRGRVKVVTPVGRCERERVKGRLRIDPPPGLGYKATVVAKAEPV